MRNTRHWLGAPVLVLVLIATACTGNGGGAGDNKPIRIGISLPLSGDFSQPGAATQQGYTIWQDMVNANGGLLKRQVELKIVDNASSEKTAASDYDRLIHKDKVDLLLGSFSSLLSVSASAVAEKAGMTYVCPSCGSPEMFKRGFKHIFFAQPATAVRQADLFAQHIASMPPQLRPKTAAYPAQDDPFTTPVVDALRRQLEVIGIKTVYRTVYPERTTNFDAIAGAIKAAHPDLVAQGAIFEDGVGLVKALRRVRYNPKVLFQTSAPTEGDQYAKAIGRANTEGVFYPVSWSPDADYPLNQQFVQQYQAKFGGVPPENTADAFATAQVLQAAVEAIGSLDQARLSEWLHNNKVQTILGPLTWDEKGAPQQTFILAQWQHGTSKIVLPREVANTDEIVFPKPDWQGQGS